MRFDASDLATMSREACNRVLRSARWQAASTLLLYYPLPDEVDVLPLIESAHESGRLVLLPVCKGEDLELRRYEGKASLVQGAFSIMEPTGEVFPEERFDEIELAIVPGMAFDEAGHRLGRGKGYYDRLLPRLRAVHTIGICFPFQRLDAVPADTHDVTMQEVIS